VWVPRPPPSAARLLADSVRDALGEPARLARSGLEAARDPQRALTAVGDTVRTVVGFTDRPAPAPWNRVVTPHRRWARATVPLPDAQSVRGERGATINDVVLSACTIALRGYLADHGGAERTTPLKAMVPVSRRADDEHGETMGNKVSLIVVDLPVDEEDPAVGLARIHDQTSELKGSGLAEGAEHIVDLAAHVPVLAAPMARLLSRSIPMNLVITNIPGPPTTLFVGGGRVLEAYPYVEVIDGEGLTIAVVSYGDALHFGLTADRDVMPDLQLLADGIEQAVKRMAGGPPAAT
jgi:WS/DGAT/MGAT family acyltransferase